MASVTRAVTDDGVGHRIRKITLGEDEREEDLGESQRSVSGVLAHGELGGWAILVWVMKLTMP